MGDMVQIQTTRFGVIQVAESHIIHFIEPIFGFENLTRFVILDHAENSPFKWLQSTEDPELAFVVTNPKFFEISYEFVLTDDVVEKLAIQNAEEVLILTLVNIPNENPALMTTNLLGPVVVNQACMQAVQLVLSDTQYSTKTRLIKDDVLNKLASSAALHQGE